MALNVAKALNIEKQERSVVFLLLTQSVFIGIFAGALDVGANALFLERYSADLIPRAFMLSGVVGILFTSVYAFLQKRIPFKAFTVLNLFIAIISTAALWLGFLYVDVEWLAFAVFVMMGPLIIISLLGFWGTAGRYFTLREGKRLFGIIDTGSIVGMILAFYAVPVLMQFDFQVFNTLAIGLVSLFTALIFQIILIRRHKFLAIKQKEDRAKKKRSNFFTLFRKRYTSLMAVFIVMSVITAFFVHFSFMWATEENYPNSKELTGFIGAFFGTMMIFTVGIKSTLYGWLMKNYGLRIALLISPALLLILTVVAAAVGGIFGYTVEAASFTFFFLVISLSKLFNKSLKDAIESPSMKILYQSLDSSERYDVQARIDGIVNEMTAFTAGLLMAGLLMISFVRVIHFSYLLIIILFVWVLLGMALYRAYRKTLNDTLATARKTDEADKELDVRKAIPAISSIPNFREMIRLNPYFYHVASERNMDDMLEHPNSELQLEGWKIICNTVYAIPESEVQKIKGRSHSHELTDLINTYLKRNYLKNKDIDAAFRSGNKDQVFAALVQIAVTKDRSHIPHIITMLRDRDMLLRSAAIETAGILKAKELGAYLVDYLDHPDLYAITWSAMVKMGEDVLENLENAFHKTGVTVRAQLRIVNAIASIGGEKASELLFSKISYHQRNIREAAINGLYRNSFTCRESHKPALQSEIYDQVRAGAWYIAAEFTVRENDPENGLIEALGEELLQANEFLFKLLAITYDRHATDHVKENLMDSENEDTGFAIELLNLIVDDQVFAYLEPYFDQLSVPDKIRRMQAEMPVELLTYEDLLRQLINRDGLHTGNYTRLCAINAIGLHKEMDASLELAAQVFHPDPVLSSSAYTILALKDKVLSENILERFPEEKLEIAETDASRKAMHLLMIIADDLKQWPTFKQVRLETLFRLAGELNISGDLDLSGDSQLTFIRSKEKTGSALMNEGRVILAAQYPQLKEVLEDICSNEHSTTAYQVDKKIFKELLFDYEDLLHAFTSMCSRESFYEPLLKQANKIE